MSRQGRGSGETLELISSTVAPPGPGLRAAVRRIQFYTRPAASVLALDFPISLAAPTCVGPTKNQFHSPSPRGVAIGAGRRQGFTPPRHMTWGTKACKLQVVGGAERHGGRALRPGAPARSSSSEWRTRREGKSPAISWRWSVHFLSFLFLFSSKKVTTTHT